MDCRNIISDSNPCNLETQMKELLTILGAGESGTGAAILGIAKGYDVFVSEKGKIKDIYKDELVQRGIAFEEENHSEERILNSILIIKSPGIPDKVEIVLRAKAKGIEIIDEIEFASRFTKANIIAITGTNGKTTTTLLIHHLLKSAGFNVGLAGNVGASFARQVTEKSFDWYVLEVSSFQLDGTKNFAPSIGVLLNITPDHLDRYEYNMQNYVDSKFRLVQSMKASQHFIYFMDDALIAKEIETRNLAPHKINVSLTKATDTKAYYDGDQMRFHLGEQFNIAQHDTTLKGSHNLINTMSAVSAAFFAGVSLENIREALKTFKNAPHRLESVGIIKGVEFINDSKATNVDAVVYALGSYDKPLVWIAGGTDKGNDYSMIADVVKKKVRALICLGVDNEKLKHAFKNSVSVIEETQSVHELVRMALRAAQEGDVVLLSPACASFDLFKNYEDRGDQFRKEVLLLKEEMEGAVN